MSSANTHFTTFHPTIQAEYVRKGATGFELVKQVLGLTFLIPVKPAVTRIETGLLIGHELDTSRSILVNLPNGQTSILQVQDGVYPASTGGFEVWLDGEAVAWSESEDQARRSYAEMAVA